MSEIIYKCKSINNKNIREGELNILRKCDNNDLCFEFGENEMNLKKRFYDNEKDFENDFKALEKLKESSSLNKSKEEEQRVFKEAEQIRDSFKTNKASKPKYNEF